MSDNFNFYDHTTLKLFDLFENDKAYNKRPQNDAEAIILVLSAFADVLAKVPYLTRNSTRLRSFVTTVRDLNEHMARQYRDLPTNLSLMTSYVQEMRGLRNTDALLRVRAAQDHARVSSAASLAASAHLSRQRLAAPTTQRGTTVEDAVALGADVINEYANLIGGAVAVPGTPGSGTAKDNDLCGSLDAAFGCVTGLGSSLMQGVVPPLASAILMVGSVLGTGATLIGPKVEGYRADDPLATMALAALAQNPRALGSVGQFVGCLQSFGYSLAGLLETSPPLNPAHLVLSGTPGGYHDYDASGAPHRLMNFDYGAFRLDAKDAAAFTRVAAAIRDLLERISVLERIRMERETTQSAMIAEIARAEAALLDLETRYAAYDGAIPTEMFAELNGFGNFAVVAAAHLACLGQMITLSARAPTAAATLPASVSATLLGQLGESLEGVATAATSMRLGRLDPVTGALGALSTTLSSMKDAGVLALIAPIDTHMPDFNEAVETALAPVGALLGGLQNMMLSESGTIAKATTRLTILTNVITLPVLAQNTCAAPLLGRIASMETLEAIGLGPTGMPATTAPETPVVTQPAPFMPPPIPSPRPVTGDEPLLPSAPKPAKKSRDTRYGASSLQAPISVSKPPKT